MTSTSSAQSRSIGTAAPFRLNHIAELDGYRGLAILLVLCVHFSMGTPGPLGALLHLGWSGVDLFFVLSGFLITSILVQARQSHDYYSRFYIRRSLRIFPLYFAFLGIYTALNQPPWERMALYWLYLGNALSAWGTSLPGINHFWSLSIEEQFYLLWPWLVYQLSNRRLKQLCAAMVIGFFVVRFVVVHWPTPSSEFVYTLLRYDSLAVGAFIAVLNCERRLDRRLVIRMGLSGLLLTSAGFLISRGTWYVHPGNERFAYTGLALVYGALLAWTVLITNGGGVVSWLRLAPLRFLGRYSYGIYVLHMLFVPLIAGLGGHPIMRVVLGTAVSACAGWVVWHIWERPFLQLKERF